MESTIIDRVEISDDGRAEAMASVAKSLLPTFSITHVDDYMMNYGAHLGYESRKALKPLHDPNTEKPLAIRLKRPPFPAQSHAISAAVKALLGELKGMFIVGEMGTGKTLLSMGVVEQHSKEHAKLSRREGRRGRRMQVRVKGVVQNAYRCLVFCPGQLVPKWGREIMETVPNASVVTIEKWDDVIRLHDRIGRNRPARPTYYIISRDRAKLSAKWVPCYHYKERHEEPVCPQCGAKIRDEKDRPVEVKKIKANKLFCKAQHEGGNGLIRECGAPLWTYVGAASKFGDHEGKLHQASSTIKGAINRWEPAKYIHKHMKEFFDYLIVDEVHEEKSAESAQANALGALIAATKYHIALTGTLIGGYANHIRPLLWRLCGRKMKAMGYNWNAEMPFNRDYGRIETTVYTSGSNGDNGETAFNSTSRGSRSQTKKSERVRPGIMPTIFGDLLLECCVFLGLAEISENLPTLEERIISVPMSGAQAKEYERIEKLLAGTAKDMVAKGDRRLLAVMLQTLLCWPDYMFGWGPVGYWEKPKVGDARPMSKEALKKAIRKAAEGGNDQAAQITDDQIDEIIAQQTKVTETFIPVVTPRNFDMDVIYPKEAKLLETIKDEVSQGRQCWVYVQYTGKRDVAKRIQEILTQNDIKAKILPATVSPDKREEWISKYGRDHQVIISHPKLVETGLDLFDKNGGHNFSTLIFYETGYNTFTLRQASRRSWRIGQSKHCKVFYFYYEGTMQSAAMELMGKKLTASLAMEGKFSSEGLAAMGADDGGIEMALAKKLSNLERADESHTARAWEKIQGGTTTGLTVAEAVQKREKEIANEPIKITPKQALAEMEELLASFTIKK